MSDEENPWSDNLYIYWLKSAKGLEYLQGGLEDFVQNVVNCHHKDLLKRTGVTIANVCNACTIENILPEHPDGKCSQKSKSKCLCAKQKRNRRLCPAGICSKMYDCIVEDHCFGDPLWSNTDPTKWCSIPWSIAKAFQTTLSPNLSAKDTDASGLLSIIINNTNFADKIGNPVEINTDQKNNVYCKARAARNDILHLPKMKIDEAKMFEYIDQFLDVLKDRKDISRDAKAMRACESLKKLKTADIIVNREDERRIRKQREALRDIELETQNALHTIQEAADQGVARINQACSNSVNLYERTPSNVTIDEKDSFELSDYEKRKSEFKEDLIYFNRQQHSTIPVSPLFETNAASLLEFYVIPELKYVDIHGKLSDISYHRRKKVAVSSPKDIFKTQTGSNANEIYVIADAGLGKTAFCKFFTVCWCHAYDPVREEEAALFNLKENSEIMKEFKFLFLISLRNATATEVHIDDMINKQVCYGLARKDSYKVQFMQRILTEERCLIIVDGLDEWKSEKLFPERRSRPKCTILTTTRTWKFSMLKLGPNEIQKKVSLSGLDDSSRKILAEKVLSNLDTTNMNYAVFKQQIKSRSLEDLAQNPLIHMSLICLWAEEKSLGETKSEIYSSLLDVLIGRLKMRSEDVYVTLEKRSLEVEKTTDHTDQLSKFYSANENCRKYKHFIESLAKLAAETLFDKTKQNTVVFGEDVTLKHLSGDCLTFSLAMGVLIKTEVPMKMLRKPPNKYSFLHKTFQEFLAAVYLCTTQKLPSVCNSLESVLDLSNVFIFLSGLSEEVISRMSQEIRRTVSNDPVVKKYRQEALSSSFIRYHRKLILKNQEMHISCLKEIGGSNFICFTIEDFIITDSFADLHNIQYLKTLLGSAMKEHTVRSLTIDNTSTKMGNISNIIEKFTLDQINSLERLDYWGISDDGDFSNIISYSENSIKCMTLHFNINNEEGRHCLLSSGTLCHLKSMQNLESLSLWYVRFDHQDLEVLLNFISEKSNMSYIGLQDIECIDGADCQGFSFDLSKHEKMEVLNIGHIPLTDIHINITSLKECRLVEFPFRGVLKSILQRLPVAKRLEIFVCHFLTDPNEINEVMALLPDLQTLKMIRFYGIDMSTLGQILPQNLKQMELLQLYSVSLSESTLTDMIQVIRNLPQMVDIELYGCSVKPSGAFEQIQQVIDQSSDLEILTTNPNEFHFRKIQKGQ